MRLSFDPLQIRTAEINVIRGFEGKYLKWSTCCGLGIDICQR